MIGVRRTFGATIYPPIVELTPPTIETPEQMNNKARVAEPLSLLIIFADEYEWVRGGKSI